MRGIPRAAAEKHLPVKGTFFTADMVADPSSICGWHESEMLYKAIQKSNREIVLSLSPGPAHIDRAWQYCRYANMLPA